MKISEYLKKIAIVFSCLMIAVAAGCYITSVDRTEDAVVPVMSERVLIPGGHSIGVRMDVRGIIVVGLEDISTEDGKTVNPGLEAGLEIGDTILEINGQKVYRSDEVEKLVNSSDREIILKIKRKERMMSIKITPVRSEDHGDYKLGVWIKDRTAGIGTLTYYDPETGKFGALGHGITDAETGSVLNVEKGELLHSKVDSVKESESGSPGEIHGIFYEAEAPIGKLIKNTKFGVFGVSYCDISNDIYKRPIVAATQEQIEEGPAYILTTINGDKIEKFEIEIEKIVPQKKKDIKSMIIRVTDKDLISRTGGIVQGMSGSPIIQHGRLIGAVTHVFVNDPERGYGIFIEHMLEAAG